MQASNKCKTSRQMQKGGQFENRILSAWFCRGRNGPPPLAVHKPGQASCPKGQWEPCTKCWRGPERVDTPWGLWLCHSCLISLTVISVFLVSWGLLLKWASSFMRLPRSLFSPPCTKAPTATPTKSQHLIVGCLVHSFVLCCSLATFCTPASLAYFASC